MIQEATERETARLGGRAVQMRGLAEKRHTNRDSYPDLPSLSHNPLHLVYELPTLHALVYRPVVQSIKRGARIHPDFFLPDLMLSCTHQGSSALLSFLQPERRE